MEISNLLFAGVRPNLNATDGQTGNTGMENGAHTDLMTSYLS